MAAATVEFTCRFTCVDDLDLDLVIARRGDGAATAVGSGALDPCSLADRRIGDDDVGLAARALPLLPRVLVLLLELLLGLLVLVLLPLGCCWEAAPLLVLNLEDCRRCRVMLVSSSSSSPSSSLIGLSQYCDVLHDGGNSFDGGACANCGCCCNCSSSWRWTCIAARTADDGWDNDSVES
jgi:hypothetical protein